MDGWLGLFRTAMAVIDAAPAGVVGDDWTIGGGTMLFRRYRHRLSHDIDIFLPSPQALPALTPRLNDVAEFGARSYVEQSHFVKLWFPSGEVDFIVSRNLLTPFADREEIEGRAVWVERPAEILAKKVLYRSAGFTARDVFDFGFLIEAGEAEPLLAEPAVFAESLAVIGRRVANDDDELRPAFARIEAVDYRPTFDHCREVVSRFVARAAPARQRRTPRASPSRSASQAE